MSRTNFLDARLVYIHELAKEGNSPDEIARIINVDTFGQVQLLLMTPTEPPVPGSLRALRAAKAGKKGDLWTCLGCGQRFERAAMETLGGGGPFCAPCAERFNAMLDDDSGPT